MTPLVIEVEKLLRRATSLIRLPGAPDRVPEVLDAGVGLRCPISGRVFVYRDGILDLLPDDAGPRTFSQHSLDTHFTAWLYDQMRDRVLRLVGLPDFPTEVASIQQRLQAGPGDVIVDLACGHGNFTVEWARLVGPSGLVLGLDISRAMLARSAARLASVEPKNVLLIHADAHQLPLASESVRKVNCSGGFHAFPDLPRALREIARISLPGAVLTTSTFAERPDRQYPHLREWLKRRLGLHFVPLRWLGEQLEALGYSEYTWSRPKGGFSYTSAIKRADGPTRGNEDA